MNVLVNVLVNVNVNVNVLVNVNVPDLATFCPGDRYLVVSLIMKDWMSTA